MAETVVKPGEEYTIEITGMNHEGQGVGRIGSFTVFADGALAGERVKVRLNKVTKSYAVADMINIEVRSKDRETPFCSLYPACGGCSLQHMSYAAQLAFKKQLVVDSIRRIGGLEDVKILDAIGMDEPFRYRNKAQYPIAPGEGRPRIGFYAKRSHDVVENNECRIQMEVSDSIKKLVYDFITERKISIYDETTGEGLLRHVMTRVAFKTGEVMVVLVLNGRRLPESEKLAELLKNYHENSFYRVTSIYINVNTANTNIILGHQNIKIFGNDTITDYIGKFKFIISPHSFLQVNPFQTDVLYRKALEYADLSGNETVFDLFCGIGTISLFLSQKARKVIGVESVSAAIKDANENARINDVKNVEFICGEAEKVVPMLYRSGVKADVVVVDPPRKGCAEALLKTLVDMQPQKIVYVSCNPSTLARDLKYLDANGFRTVEVQPVDMFPWTAHVECVIMMTYCGSKGK